MGPGGSMGLRVGRRSGRWSGEWGGWGGWGRHAGCCVGAVGGRRTGKNAERPGSYQTWENADRPGHNHPQRSPSSPAPAPAPDPDPRTPYAPALGPRPAPCAPAHVAVPDDGVVDAARPKVLLRLRTGSLGARTLSLLRGQRTVCINLPPHVLHRMKQLILASASAAQV